MFFLIYIIMKYIKFFEKFRTQDDTSDLLISLLDAGDIVEMGHNISYSFRYSQIRLSTHYKITLPSTTLEELEAYSNFLNKLVRLCKKWNLIVYFRGIQFEIIQVLYTDNNEFLINSTGNVAYMRMGIRLNPPDNISIDSASISYNDNELYLIIYLKKEENRNPSEIIELLNKTGDYKEITYSQISGAYKLIYNI